jgi:hypothetical protein
MVIVQLRRVLVLPFVLVLAAVSHTSAQVVHATGQNVVPVYEGWEPNGDGTFTMVFGYFNRNLEEEPFVPVGPNNMFEPGDPDRGQPTHFYPRRQQFMFRVPVPKDWGKKELVWTLISHGRTEKAYGSLLPIWQIGQVVYEQNRSSTLLRSPYDPVNQPPSVTLLSPPQSTVMLPDTLTLTVSVTDDGLPSRRLRQGTGAVTVRSEPEGPTRQAVVKLDPAWKLGVSWVHHRGPGTVTFDPMRQPIADGKGGKAVTKASFSEPGTYVLRAYADDGVLTSSVDVTVMVKRGPPGDVQR